MAGPGSTGGVGGDSPSSSTTTSSSSAGDGGSGVGGSGVGGSGAGGPGQGGSGADGPGAGGSGGGDVSALDLGVPVGPVVVRTDDSVVVEIAVERTGPSVEPAIITVESLPDGVTADALEIPADEPIGELTLHGAVDALQGLATAEITATAADLVDTAPVELVVAGAPGSPDETFVNATGTFAMQVAAAATRARAVVIQPDGKIVVAGTTTTGNGGLMVAVRFDGLGVPDGDFGDAGVFVGGPGQSGALAVTVDDQDRIILAGIAYINFEGGSQLALHALTPEGTDATVFGEGGTAASGVVSGWGQFRAVFPTAGGALAMGENYLNGSNQNAVVYEYTDASDVITRTHIFDGTETLFYGRQPDGKLLYGGRDLSNSMTITRLSAPDTVDSSFNFSGTQAVFFDGRVSYATGVHVDDDERILLGGYADAAGDARIALAKLNGNGSPVATFGVGGKVVTGISMRTKSSSSIVVDSQGRIVFGGYVGTTTQTPALARFNPDGTADETFGTAGLVVLDDLAVVAGNDWQSVWGIAVDELDRVLVVGEFGANDSSTFFVTRRWF